MNQSKEELSSGAIYFVLVSAIWANAFRFLLYRSTDFLVPPSLMYGIISISFLLFAIPHVPHAGSLRIEKLKIVFMLMLILLSFFIGKIISGNISDRDLAIIWSYFLFPISCLLIGIFFRKKTTLALKKTIPSGFITLSTILLLICIIINSVDIIFRGDEIENLYRGFATTAPATIGSFRFYRITGPYFSSIDLALATLILISVRNTLGIGSRFTNFLLLFVLIFTFTRNVYVLVILIFLFQKYTSPTKDKFILGFIIGIGLTIFSALSIGTQVASGDIESSEELSSVITRFSSWLSLAQVISASPSSLVFGIGYSQNYFGQSAFDVYAIDNLYFELLSLGGILAIFSFVGIGLFCIKTSNYNQTRFGRFIASLFCTIPVFGVFNNVLGWAMFSLIFTFVFATSSRPEARR